MAHLEMRPLCPNEHSKVLEAFLIHGTPISSIAAAIPCPESEIIDAVKNLLVARLAELGLFFAPPPAPPQGG